MPIYAYKCGSCGHQKDVLQKISDEPLTICPACGAATFSKQLTAAGFQLKGSGWYVTEFKSGPTTAPATEPKADEAKPETKVAAEAGNSADAAAPAVQAKPDASPKVTTPATGTSGT